MDILVDSSALMPVLLNEPEKGKIINLTKNCRLLAPSILPHEIGNALTRLRKRRLLSGEQVVAAYKDFRKIPLRLVDAEIERALLLANKYSLYGYDACYLEIAGRLNLPLLTMDRTMKRAATALKLRNLEKQDENI